MSMCIVGAEDETNKVVGRDFKVVGLKGLRFADMSTCPILTTNHIQVNVHHRKWGEQLMPLTLRKVNAYLIGERCADLVLTEHNR